MAYELKIWSAYHAVNCYLWESHSFAFLFDNTSYIFLNSNNSLTKLSEINPGSHWTRYETFKPNRPKWKYQDLEHRPKCTSLNGYFQNVEPWNQTAWIHLETVALLFPFQQNMDRLTANKSISLKFSPWAKNFWIYILIWSFDHNLFYIFLLFGLSNLWKFSVILKYTY